VCVAACVAEYVAVCVVRSELTFENFFTSTNAHSLAALVLLLREGMERGEGREREGEIERERETHTQRKTLLALVRAHWLSWYCC